MNNFTPQFKLVFLFALFLGLFLLPAFRIPVTLPAYVWTDAAGNVVNPKTHSAQDVSAELQGSIQLREGSIHWNGIDFSLFGIQSPLANFTRGNDLYQQISYSYLAGNYDPQTFASDVALVRNRMDAAGLTSVQFTTSIQGQEARMIFDFPEGYNQQEAGAISSLLVSPGQIQFFKRDPNPIAETDNELYSALIPGFVPIEIPVSAADIASVRVVNRTEYLLPVWEITFRESVKDILYASLLELGVDAEDTTTAPPTVAAFSVELDGLPQFALIYQRGLTFVGVPLGIIGRYSEVNVAASYVISLIGIRSNFIIDGDQLTAPDYAPLGRVVLGINILTVSLLAAYLAFRNGGARAVLAGLLSLFVFLALALAILKLVAFPISLGFVIAYAVALIVGVYSIRYLWQTDESLGFKTKARQIRDLAVLLFAVTAGIYISGMGFGVYLDALGAMTMFALSLFLCSSTALWGTLFNWSNNN